jgi:HlyD family secretion protein
MKLKINFKSKKFWAIIIILLIIIIVVIPKGSKKVSYETVKVERGDLVQTVDATGKIESAKDISLHFQMSGNISKIKVKEGDKVAVGDLLGYLSLPELDASVAQAQASLDQKNAGATEEQISISEKQTESARISLEKAKISLQDVTKLGENNLKAKYNYVLSIFDDANIKIYNSYTLATTIKDTYFNSPNQQGIKVQNILSYKLETAKNNSSLLINKVKTGSYNDIDISIDEMNKYLDNVLSGLADIRDVCDEADYSDIVPDTTRTSLDTQKATISTAKTSMTTVKNEIAVLKVQNENNINTAKAAVDSAEANLSIQEANLKSIKANPRDVDVAYYRAVLDQAKANRAKALLYSPIDGVISKVNKNSGELVNPSDVVIEIISPHYEIKIDIPETDVVKISNDDESEITFDALGSDVKFKGKVLTIEPASTEIQDVVYYKVKISIENNDERVKPGMTANVLINTDKKENALYLPYRAVLSEQKDGRKYVKIINNGTAEEKDVILGLKADDGFIEILSGVSQGEEVVLKTIGTN